MSFMKPEGTEKQAWIEIDGKNGIFFFPRDCFNRSEAIKAYGGSLGDGIDSVRVYRGYGIRLSAPGYLDCTDWEVYRNKRVAIKRFNELKREQD